MIAFAFFVWFVNRVLWGPLSKIMNDRQKKISDGLSAAEKGKHELEVAEQKAKEVLKDAKTQAQAVLGQAEKRGSEIVEDAKVKATEEAERIKASIKAELDQEASRTRESLRKEVSALVIAGAEKILKKEVNSSTHDDMLQSLAQKL